LLDMTDIQAAHYLDLASQFRSLASVQKSSEARDDLRLLAAEYERLAEFAGSYESVETAGSKDDCQPPSTCA